MGEHCSAVYFNNVFYSSRALYSSRRFAHFIASAQLLSLLLAHIKAISVTDMMARGMMRTRIPTYLHGPSKRARVYHIALHKRNIKCTTFTDSGALIGRTNNDYNDAQVGCRKMGHFKHQASN